MSTKLKLELQIHFCPFDERCHGDEFVVRKMELSAEWASIPCSLVSNEFQFYWLNLLLFKAQVYLSQVEHMVNSREWTL